MTQKEKWIILNLLGLVAKAKEAHTQSHVEKDIVKSTNASVAFSGYLDNIKDGLRALLPDR